MFIIKSFKRYSKHLFVLLTSFILIFSIQLNVFAATSFTANFYNGSYHFYYLDETNNKNVEITSECGVSRWTVLNRECTGFVFPGKYHTYNRVLHFGVELPFYTDTAYTFSGAFTQNFAKDMHVIITLWYGSESSNLSALTLYDGTGFGGSSWIDYNGSFVLPAISGSSVKFALVVQMSVTKTNSTLNNAFYFTDLVFNIDSPLYGEHYIPPETNIEGSIDDYNDIINNLPTVNSDNLSDLMSSFDISDFTESFDCFNTVFDTLITSLNLTQILLFTLTFGLGIYVLGRRLR